MAYLPRDPYILLSYVNTKLRDEFPSLAAFCDEQEVDRTELESALATLDARYDREKNQFIIRSES